MAGHARRRGLRVIHGGQGLPIRGALVARITTHGGWNMRRRFARDLHAIVAALAGAQGFKMIQGFNGRLPYRRGMTLGAIIGSGQVGGGFADNDPVAEPARTRAIVVATETGAQDVQVIHLGGGHYPGARGMTGITDRCRIDMRRAFAAHLNIVKHGDTVMTIATTA